MQTPTVSVRRPDWRFLVAHPAHMLALGFGAGLAPIAPGTFGTLVAIPIAWVLRLFGDVAFAIALVAGFAIGVWASGVAGRALGDADHGAIVWDEVVAFALVLFFVGDSWRGIAFAFVLFRAFDILKPPPIRELERRISGGLGVMADDIGAAIYTLLVLAIAQRLMRAMP
jgi:phosphatidylglycerophosphatase A